METKISRRDAIKLFGSSIFSAALASSGLGSLLASCTDMEPDFEVKPTEAEILRNEQIKLFYDRMTPYLGDRQSDMVFICVPDMHCCYETMVEEHLPFLVKTNGFGERCRIMISGGDILFDGRTKVAIDEILSDYVPRYQQMVKKYADSGFAFLAGLAGHDFNNYDRAAIRDYQISNNLTKQQQKECFILPGLHAIDNNEILRERYSYNISEDPSVCYYYVDDKITGHRIVILDETDHPQTSKDGENYDYDTYSTVIYQEKQIKWLIEALESVPQGKYVIVVNHVGLNLSAAVDIAGTVKTIKKIIAAFVKKGIYEGDQGNDGIGYSWSVERADFSRCGGIFGGLYKGHTHVHEYSKMGGAFPQICSTNPDSYPWRSTSNPTYDIPYLGDLYLINNCELRNFHYGRNDMKDGGTQEWVYNAFTDRWIDSPIILK